MAGGDTTPGGGGGAVPDYERERLANIERNKARLAQLTRDLDTSHLVQQQQQRPQRRQVHSTPRQQQQEHQPARASARNAGKERPNYSEHFASAGPLARYVDARALGPRPTGRRGRGGGGGGDRGEAIGSRDAAGAYPAWHPDLPEAPGPARQRAFDAAVDLAEQLTREHKTPAFAKEMSASKVSGGFWLQAPPQLADHLAHDADVTFTADEAAPVSSRAGPWSWNHTQACRREGELRADTWSVGFIMKKNRAGQLTGGAGFSKNWRGFCIDMFLHPEDCVVFQVLGPRRCHVHLCRAWDHATSLPDGLAETRFLPLAAAGAAAAAARSGKQQQQGQQQQGQGGGGRGRKAAAAAAAGSSEEDEEEEDDDEGSAGSSDDGDDDEGLELSASGDGDGDEDEGGPSGGSSGSEQQERPAPAAAADDDVRGRGARRPLARARDQRRGAAAAAAAAKAAGSKRGRGADAAGAAAAAAAATAAPAGASKRARQQQQQQQPPSSAAGPSRAVAAAAGAAVAAAPTASKARNAGNAAAGSSSGGDELIVDAIVAVRRAPGGGNGRRGGGGSRWLYKVKWLGQPAAWDSWEPASSFVGGDLRAYEWRCEAPAGALP